MPKVSVILPIYNVASYLDETFQSLLGQTMTDIEIIAIDDGSTDDSLNYIKKYAHQDSRISFYTQTNQGQSVARNVGMKYATGEYIYFMDSDDTILPNAIEQCYYYIEKTQADFIFFDADTILEAQAKPISWDYKRTQFIEEYKQYNGEALLNMMLDNGKHSCVVWGLFIRKSYVNNIKLSFYPGIIHEDELYTTILTLQSKNIFGLNLSLVNHRVRQASTMGISYSKRNINCYLTVIDELHKFKNTPIIHKFSRYTLSKVFYTGHRLPFKDKFGIYWRAIKSRYFKYIGWKSTFVFWFKSAKNN